MMNMKFSNDWSNPQMDILDCMDMPDMDEDLLHLPNSPLKTDKYELHYRKYTWTQKTNKMK